jgi:DNA segregation ATPase FtsK/SpoIIIE, S-DNA-T family
MAVSETAMFDRERLKTDLLALGLLALVVFIGLSFASYDPADPPSQLIFPARANPTNLCGPAGAAFAYHARQIFGVAIWLMLLTLIMWDFRLFSREGRRQTVPTVAGMICLVLSACAALQLLAPRFDSGSVYGSGGQLGAWTGVLLLQEFSPVGTTIIVGCCFVAGWLLTPLAELTQPAVRMAMMPRAAIARAATSWDNFRAARDVHATQPGNGTADDEPATVPFQIVDAAEDMVDDDDVVEEDLPEPELDREIRINPPAALTLHQPDVGVQVQREEYELPNADILEPPQDFPYEKLAARARIAAATLEKTFEEFGLNVKVAEIDTGPVVTQFELDLEPGLRVSKLAALEDDLAIALRVPSVRIVTPIPGKNTVGVEVPNENQVMVRLRELLQLSGGSADAMKLPLFLGKDVSGHSMAVDLAKMPHLLIAGRTGTGKSVCLNTLILSLLMTRTPDDVRMLMIDPKMVELSPYKRIPHLMHPVITDMKKAEAVLAWAVDKMEERYGLLAEVGVRHLDGYNRLGRDAVLKKLGLTEDDAEAEDVPERMPYIVIIADEMADLMMTAGKEVEASIIRLAQKSRAVGIHLVLATQKPTVDVITGLIKSNLPARISFQVASRMDSRVVLDEGGAERLLGCGDMLYLAPGTSNLSRAQGTYVSDDEINAVIDFFSNSEPQYSPELARLTAGSGGAPTAGDSGPRNHDDLYESAIDVVIREGRGSVSLLQRCLGIGYGRAARMIDYMAEDGIVGDYNGAQARDVLYSSEQWEQLQAERENDPS